jgi:hypothetical protein
VRYKLTLLLLLIFSGLYLSAIFLDADPKLTADLGFPVVFMLGVYIGLLRGEYEDKGA